MDYIYACLNSVKYFGFRCVFVYALFQFLGAHCGYRPLLSAHTIKHRSQACPGESIDYLNIRGAYSAPLRPRCLADFLVQSCMVFFFLQCICVLIGCRPVLCLLYSTEFVQLVTFT